MANNNNGEMYNTIIPFLVKQPHSTFGSILNIPDKIFTDYLLFKTFLNNNSNEQYW